MRLRVPHGFTRFSHGGAEVVAMETVGDGVREALGGGTLYAWASGHPDRREYRGRQAAFSAPLPFGGPRVVVRHSRHGGLLALLTRDIFLAPTRAPYELLVSALLGRAGVPTPPVIAFALYPVAPLLWRSDIASLELHGQDLGTIMAESATGGRGAWLDSVAALLRGLTRAGAWHPDLNVRNILLTNDDDGARRAFVLDVDRIRFHPPGDPNVRDANLQRLMRSVRKWRAAGSPAFDESELRTLRELAQPA